MHPVRATLHLSYANPYSFVETLHVPDRSASGPSLEAFSGGKQNIEQEGRASALMEMVLEPSARPQIMGYPHQSTKMNMDSTVYSLPSSLLRAYALLMPAPRRKGAHIPCQIPSPHDPRVSLMCFNRT